MHRVQSHKLIPTYKKRPREDSVKNTTALGDLNNNVEKPPFPKRRGAEKRSVLPQRSLTQAPELQLWRKAPDGWSQSTDMIFSILSAMRKDEIRSLPDGDPASDIEPWMRATLIDWLVQVDHHLHLCMGTLYRATQFVDRFAHCERVTTGKYQLLGTVAIWIATKLEERYQAEIAELVDLTDGTCEIEDAFEMERLVLQKLDFRLNGPEPSFYVRMYADMCSDLLSERGRQLLVRRSWYILDLFVVQPIALDTLASKAAAAVVCMLLEVVKVRWPESIEVLIGYSKNDLGTLMQFMAKLVLSAKTNKYSCGAYAKFSSDRFGRAAKDPSWVSSQVLLRLAESCTLRPLMAKASEEQ